MGLFSRETVNTTAVTNHAYDQRQVYDAGGGIVGQGNWWDQSIKVTDARSAVDSRSIVDSRSFVGTDAEAISATNAALLRDLGGQQSDGLKAIAGFGAQGVRELTESAVDLYGAAGQNTTLAWNRTLDTSERLLASILDGAQNTTDSARSIASEAISSFQPAENKQTDTLKWALIAAAGVAALYLFRK